MARNTICYQEIGTGKKIAVPHTYKDPNWKKDIEWSKYSNDDLLQWAEKAKSVPAIQVSVIGCDGMEHIVEIKGTLAFQTHYGTEFDYGQLSRELADRGAKNGFYFPDSTGASERADSEPIILDLNKFHRGETYRLQLTVSIELRDKLEELVTIENAQEKSYVIDMLLAHEVDRLLEKKARKEIIIRRDQEVTKVETVETPM